MAKTCLFRTSCRPWILFHESNVPGFDKWWLEPPALGYAIDRTSPSPFPGPTVWRQLQAQTVKGTAVGDTGKQKLAGWPADHS